MEHMGVIGWAVIIENLFRIYSVGFFDLALRDVSSKFHTAKKMRL